MGSPGLRNPLVAGGGALVGLLVVLALAARVVAPYDPTEMKVADALKAPSAVHLFGTDRFGRDVLSRTIYGSRIALGVALASIGLAFGVGATLGLVSGFWGGWSDLVIGRVMDVLFSFPTLILAIAVAAMLGPGPTTPCSPLPWSTFRSSAGWLGDPCWPSGSGTTSPPRGASGRAAPAFSCATSCPTSSRR